MLINQGKINKIKYCICAQSVSKVSDNNSEIYTMPHSMK